MPLWTNPCFRQKTRPVGRLQRTHPKAASWRARERGRVTFIFNPAGGLGDTKPRSHGRTEQKQEQDTSDTENINTSVWLQSPFTSFSYQDPGSRANKRQIRSRGPALATLSSEKTEVRIQGPIRRLCFHRASLGRQRRLQFSSQLTTQPHKHPLEVSGPFLTRVLPHKGHWCSPLTIFRQKTRIWLIR